MGVIRLNGPMAWFSLVVILTGFVIAPLYLRRHWCGGTIANDFIVAGYWYKSDEFRRGHRRAVIPIFITGYALFVLGLSMFVVPSPEPGRVNLLAIIVAVVFVIVLAAFLLYWSIMLFNAPRFLVAPHHRDEPGVLAEKRAKRSW